jgi:hypothetical protein
VEISRTAKMSCDFAVWSTTTRLDDAGAGMLYGALCDGDVSGVAPSRSIDAFYRELTSLHPEIDHVPEADIGDTDVCPWSIAFDRSPGHLILCCVWSKADYVYELVHRLANKHGLAVFDPQSEVVTYPSPVNSPSAAPARKASKPWWRFW